VAKILLWGHFYKYLHFTFNVQVQAGLNAGFRTMLFP